MENKETIKEVAERLTENAYRNDVWEEGRLKRVGYYQGIIDGMLWMEEQMESLKDFNTWKEWKNKSKDLI
jgi:hypothetical protein